MRRKPGVPGFPTEAYLGHLRLSQIHKPWLTFWILTVCYRQITMVPWGFTIWLHMVINQWAMGFGKSSTHHSKSSSFRSNHYFFNCKFNMFVRRISSFVHSKSSFFIVNHLQKASFPSRPCNSMQRRGTWLYAISVAMGSTSWAKWTIYRWHHGFSVALNIKMMIFLSTK